MCSIQSILCIQWLHQYFIVFMVLETKFNGWYLRIFFNRYNCCQLIAISNFAYEKKSPTGEVYTKWQLVSNRPGLNTFLTLDCHQWWQIGTCHGDNAVPAPYMCLTSSRPNQMEWCWKLLTNPVIPEKCTGQLHRGYQFLYVLECNLWWVCLPTQWLLFSCS